MQRIEPAEAAVAPVVEPVRRRPGWVQVVSGLVFPLFFVVMFSLSYVSAFHAPAPHEAPVYLVGSPEQTAPVQEALLDSGAGAFDVRTTASTAVAEEAIASRQVLGAVELGRPVTAHVASAAGSAAATAVEHLARQIADQTGAPLRIQDVVPSAPGDGSGTGLFYFLVVCTIGGYLAVTVLAQTAARLRLGRRYGILAAVSAVVPVLTFALSSLFVGAYGMDGPRPVLALLAVGAIYTFTIGAVSILAHQLAGKAAIFLVLTVVVFLNFPSAGGAFPAQFLPGFWQAVHQFWVGSAGMEAFRDLVYFPAADPWPWLGHLAAWLLATVVGTLVLDKARPTEAAGPVADPTATAPADHPARGHASGPTGPARTAPGHDGRCVLPEHPREPVAPARS